MEIYFLSHNIRFGGWCVASKKYIADFLDLSERTVFESIKTLEQKGYIEKNEYGKVRTLDEINETIKPLIGDYAKIAEPMQKLQSDHEKIAEPLCKNFIAPMQKLQTSIIYSKTISKTLNTNTSFETFWKEYPKKVGKGEAEKSWKKNNPPINDVLKTLSWQKTSDQWRRGFVPNPSTYLNQCRWLDEKQESFGIDLSKPIS